ncbi:MAG TPA: hypothetical protein EYP36_04625, partial [Calditrichaeota bacterium]|nr:hypothetical protein [Calditrichota bacterium]
MSNDIKIVIIVAFVLFVTKVLLVLAGRNKKEDTEILVLWILITAAASLTHNFYIVVFLLILIKIFFLKNDLSKNITAYFALWTIIPAYFIMDFPLSSLPLMNATFQRMTMVIWILPLLPKLLNQASLKGRRVLFDIPVLYLIAMGIVVAFSEHYHYQITTIGSVKETMQLFMDLVIPYFVIVLWADTWSKLKKVLFAFMLGGLALSVFGVLEAVLNWNVFTEMVFSGMLPVDETYKYRAFLRARASFPEPISYGVFVLITMGLSFAVMFRTKNQFMVKLLIIMIFLAALYAAQSRGDQIAAVLFLTMYFFYKMQSSSRFILLILMIIFLSVAGYIFKQQSPVGVNTDMEKVDKHGTFEYRKEMFFALLDLIPKHPYFGNTMYKKDPSMEKLRQGEGIIDPVNSYLAMAVELGLVTLFFFVLFIIRSARAGIGLVKYGYAVNNQLWVNLGAAVTATVMALSVALAFTSFSDTNPPVFWFTMGVARAIQLNLKKKLEIEKGKDEYDLG